MTDRPFPDRGGVARPRRGVGRWYATSAALAALCGLLWAVAGPAGGAEPPEARPPIVGTVARVVDADTWTLADGTTVRLWGVQADERGGAGWHAARAFVTGLLLGAEVACDDTGERSRGRVVAPCRLPDGRDVGRIVVEAGWGRDCPRYSRGAYAAAEVEASRAIPLPRFCEAGRRSRGRPAANEGE